MYHIGGHTYELIKDHKNAWNVEVFRDRYSDVLDRYDYIVGDWGYNQLRLKGFLKEANAKNNKEQSIALLEDYLNEYCNFGCAYFIVEKLPMTKAERDAELERQAREQEEGIAPQAPSVEEGAASAVEVEPDSMAAKAAARDYREGRGFLDQKEGRYSREPREPKEPKEPRFMREPKPERDPREGKPERDGKGGRPGRDGGRDGRDGRDQQRAHISSTPGFPKKESRPQGQGQGSSPLSGPGQARDGKPGPGGGYPQKDRRPMNQGQGQASNAGGGMGAGRDSREGKPERRDSGKEHREPRAGDGRPSKEYRDREPRDSFAKGGRDSGKEQGAGRETRENRDSSREKDREHRPTGPKPFNKNHKDRGRDKDKTEPAV